MNQMSGLENKMIIEEEKRENGFSSTKTSQPVARCMETITTRFLFLMTNENIVWTEMASSLTLSFILWDFHFLKFSHQIQPAHRTHQSRIDFWLFHDFSFPTTVSHLPRIVCYQKGYSSTLIGKLITEWTLKLRAALKGRAKKGLFHL